MREGPPPLSHRPSCCWRGAWGLCSASLQLRCTWAPIAGEKQICVAQRDDAVDRYNCREHGHWHRARGPKSPCPQEPLLLIPGPWASGRAHINLCWLDMFTFCPKTGYEKDLENLTFWWSVATSWRPRWFKTLFLSHSVCWVQGDGHGKEGVPAAFKCTECAQLQLAPGVGDRGCFQLSSLQLSDNTQGFGQQERQQQTCTSVSKEWGETQWPCSVSLGHAPLRAGPRFPDLWHGLGDPSGSCPQKVSREGSGIHVSSVLWSA